MTKEDLELKDIATEYADHPALNVNRMARAILRLLAQEEAHEADDVHFCVACHHQWSGDDGPTEYCGDCHRQFQALKAQFPAWKAQEEERQAGLAKLRGDGWERVPGGGAPFQCHACGHRHTGRKLGNICIGCPCEQREAQD